MKYAVVAASLFAAVFAQGPAYGNPQSSPGTSDPAWPVTFVTVTVTSCSDAYPGCSTAYTPTEPAYTPQSIPPYNTGYTPSGGAPSYPTGGWGAPSYPTNTPSTPVTSPTWGAPQYPTTSPTGSWSTPATTPSNPAYSTWGTTPSGTWATTPSGTTPSGSWTKTPTQPAYSSSTWTPPTGAGEKVQAAGLLMGAGALVALFL
ncbi:hypothetical protein BDY17DRAFT_321309 [Neohortaea acidophila]|uniref:Uncharacterized protein n=1 Tax=Neohortaea acidophila TaxID=245834 RepID=A0A6A6Q2P7_9PEZI|nr:uncharacterized protein BDY17DRAFT_321309 [Neohortaea acidophila]KAF2486522.1 hypothetical protein BDY17DRAFT_321309 [Neohortaea acidophila]